MASKLTSLGDRNSFLQCTICQENKNGRIPKALSCLHSFCCECLIKWQETKGVTETLECPFCRFITKLPTDGIRGLPDDFKVQEFVDLMRAVENPIFCQACPPEKRGLMATMLCNTCDRRLCYDCHAYHISCDIFSGHNIVPFKYVCLQHGKTLTHFCLDCMKGVCIECILWKTHEKHDVHKLCDCIGKVRELFKSGIDALNNICQLFQSSVEEIKTEELKKLNGFETSLLEKVQTLTDDVGLSLCKTVSRCRLEEVRVVDQQLNVFIKDHLPKDEFYKELNDILTLSDEGTACEISKTWSTLRAAREKIEMLKKDNYPHPNWSEKYQQIRNSTDIAGMLGISNIKNRLMLQFMGEKIGKPALVFAQQTTDDSCKGIPLQIETLEDGSALVAFRGEGCVTRLDTKGNAIRYYHTNSAKSDIFFTTDGEFLYILCDDGATIFKTNLETSHRDILAFQAPEWNIDQLIGIAFDQTNNSLIVSETNRVYRYDCVDLHPVPCNLEKGFIRTLSDRPSAHIVVISDKSAFVCDADETVTHTIPYDEKCKLTFDAAYVCDDILLLLDAEQEKIIKYDLMKKCVVADLLTKDDGLHRPYTMAFSFPYLWVAGKSDEDSEESYGSLNLYKWAFE